MRARDNPFRTERILQVRYRLEGTTWPELLKRCEVLGYRGAVVGPHGCGKTTLLEDLEFKLRESGFATHVLRLDVEHPRFASAFVRQFSAELAPNDIVLLDGAEQLSLVSWHWFRYCTRRAGGLIITVHRPGRLPTLWECSTSASLLAAIASNLLGEDAALLRESAQFLFERSGGNLREALREWYDLLAQQPGPYSAEMLDCLEDTATDCTGIDHSGFSSARDLISFNISSQCLRRKGGSFKLSSA